MIKYYEMICSTTPWRCSKLVPLGLSIRRVTLGGCFVTFSVFYICLKCDEGPKKLSQGCFVQRCILPRCADFGAYFRCEFYVSVSRWLVRKAALLRWQDLVVVYSRRMHPSLLGLRSQNVECGNATFDPF